MNAVYISPWQKASSFLDFISSERSAATFSTMWWRILKAPRRSPKEFFSNRRCLFATNYGCTCITSHICTPSGVMITSGPFKRKLTRILVISMFASHLKRPTDVRWLVLICSYFFEQCIGWTANQCHLERAPCGKESNSGSSGKKTAIVHHGIALPTYEYEAFINTIELVIYNHRIATFTHRNHCQICAPLVYSYLWEYLGILRIFLRFMSFVTTGKQSLQILLRTTASFVLRHSWFFVCKQVNGH